jgi:hypothetical protein
MRDPIKAIKQQQSWARDIVEEIKSDIDAEDLDVMVFMDVLSILGLKLAKSTPVGVNDIPITAAAYFHLCAPDMIEERLLNGEPA